jgi:hypothetical protein
VLRGPQDPFSPPGVCAPTEIVLPQTLQFTDIIREQAEDPDCRQYAENSGTDSIFDVNDSGILVRRAPLDGAEQIVVPSTLRPRLLHLEHYPKTAGHPGVSRMFRSLRRR